MHKWVGAKIGDTLIEVTLAIGIFSLVAISVVSVVSGSTTGAQTALETTLTREEIDAQAEALRFIQESYISVLSNGVVKDNDPYRALWYAVTGQKIGSDGKREQTLDIGNTHIDYDTPNTCQELYNQEDENNKQYLVTQKAFVINTRLLGQANKINQTNQDSQGGQENPEDSINLNHIVIKANDANIIGDKIIFRPTTTYPRLVFDDAGNNNKLQSAEGIYVVPAIDPASTYLAEPPNDNGEVSISQKSAYYDFYIRSCWYATGSDKPSTISTVIRLYDPDVIHTSQIIPEPEPEPEPTPVTYTVTYYEGKSSNEALIETQTITKQEPAQFRNSLDEFENSSDNFWYAFKGWCTTRVSLGSTCPEANNYQAGSTIPESIYQLADDNGNINLYGWWEKQNYSLTFIAGEHIEFIMVAIDSEAYKPHYASAGENVTFNNLRKDTNVVVTVIPESGYILSSWSGDIDNHLAESSLLSTTYKSVNRTRVLTATGTSGSYEKMQNVNFSSCPAEGANVTDMRNGRSYAIKKFSYNGDTFCYMLSNLRLEGGIALDSTTSDISSNGVTYLDPNTNSYVTVATFTTPNANNNEWTNANENYYCRANQAYAGNEYYYNWYAVTANPYKCSDPTNDSNANESKGTTQSLGSICPKHWEPFAAESLKNGSQQVFDNYLLVDNRITFATTGYFISGSQQDIGNSAVWYGNKTANEGVDTYSTFIRSLGSPFDREISKEYMTKYGFSLRCAAKDESIEVTTDAYTIHYEGNGGSGQMIDQHPKIGESVTLSANNFTREGYIMVSWNTRPDGTGTTYAKDEAINNGLSNTPGETITLYAQWQLAEKECNPSGTTINDIVCMQDINNNNKMSILKSMTSEAQYQLKDSRDNKYYYVSKLKDGNIWMTQNLDLDLGVNYLTNNDPILRHSDTDIGWGENNYDENAEWNTSSAISTGVSDWRYSYAQPVYHDPGDRCWKGNFNDAYDGTIETETTPCIQDGNHYHLGNYYNDNSSWATSGDLGRKYYFQPQGTDVNQSICPAGWMLPKGGPTYTEPGSFIYLFSSYGSALKAGSNGNLHLQPLYFTYTGSIGIQGQKEYKIASNSSYITSIVYGVVKSVNSDLFPESADIDAFVNGDFDYIDNGADAKLGATLRCVTRGIAETATYTINYNANGGSGSMSNQTAVIGGSVKLSPNSFSLPGAIFNGWNTKQDGSGTSYPNIVNVLGGLTTTPGAIITLYAQWDNVPRTYLQYMDGSLCTTTPRIVYDKRDEQPYTIQRLADGNCWMMDNLNLGDLEHYPIQVDNIDISNTNTDLGISTEALEKWQVLFRVSDGIYSTGKEGRYMTVPGTDDFSHSKYGILYNYCAASAGNHCNYDVNYAVPDTVTLHDICPAGWRLPTGGEDGDIAKLYKNERYNDIDKLRASVAAGGAAFSTPGLMRPYRISVENCGFYWTSSCFNTGDKCYAFELIGDNVPGFDYHHSRAYETFEEINNGASVRCLFRDINTYTIKYNANGGSGAMSEQLAVIGDSVQLYQNLFTKSDAIFIGWSTNKDGSGTSYMDAQHLDSGFEVEPGDSLTLYAQWQSRGPLSCNPSGTTIITINCMQDINPSNIASIKNSMVTGASYLLYDSRDWQTYNVAKLIDDSLWMRDNLALDLVATPLNILKGRTNASDTTLEYLKNGGGTDQNQYPSEGVSYDEYFSVYRPGYPSIYASRGSDEVIGYGDGRHQIGIMYNFCAASAGFYCFGSQVMPDIEYATEDICPSGWKMPSGGENGEYEMLRQKYYNDGSEGNDRLQEELESALAVSLSGYMAPNNVGLKGLNETGEISFSKRSDNGLEMSYTMGLIVRISSLEEGYIPRETGRAVRCVLKN